MLEMEFNTLKEAVEAMHQFNPGRLKKQIEERLRHTMHPVRFDCLFDVMLRDAETEWEMGLASWY